jgi:alkaline phosphatase
MNFEHDRKNDAAGEPSLTEMTVKAIDILSQNKKGYFLMVEGGLIDHGHHFGNAFRALTETIEFSNAVRAALKKVDLDESLVIVTADHSHTLTIGGYPARGNNILGLVRGVDSSGKLAADYSRDKLGLPRTTLNYANGPGYSGESDQEKEGIKHCCDAPKSFKSIKNGRPDLTKVDTTDPDYLQEGTLPLSDETHGGEDVPIFATGVNAYLVRGSMEENWIFYVAADALRMERK